MIIENRFFRLEFTWWWTGWRKKPYVQTKLDDIWKADLETGVLNTVFQPWGITSLLKTKEREKL